MRFELQLFTGLLYNQGLRNSRGARVMKRFLGAISVLAVLCSAYPSAYAARRHTTSPHPAAAVAPVPAPGQNLITMNFQDVDIAVLARFISDITGKNFVLDESVRGKVSVISPTKVTPDQAYSIFQSVLNVKGFTTVQTGSIIKIIPSQKARESSPLTTSQQPGHT